MRYASQPRGATAGIPARQVKIIKKKQVQSQYGLPQLGSIKVEGRYSPEPKETLDARPMPILKKVPSNRPVGRQRS